MVQSRSVAGVVAVIVVVSLGFGLCLGCQQEETRQPTAAEIKDANAKRFAEIDKMPISDQQKANMKAEIEGRPLQNLGAAAAAKHGAEMQPGRRMQ